MEQELEGRPPLVGVCADLREFDGHRWHAATGKYVEAAARAAGALPVIVPALGPELDSRLYLDRVDGLLLTGSKSNVHPSHYGAATTPAHEPYDEARDATVLPVILAALDRGMPLFAICRGMQELNVALGGTLAAEIQALPGRFDHRAPDSAEQDDRFAIRHPVAPRPGGLLASIVGDAPVMVNSVHRQGIDRLAPRLEVEATAEDGTIEAVSVRGAAGFALGVQWHPEYWAESDLPSRRLFEAFGAALRERIARRAAAE